QGRVWAYDPQNLEHESQIPATLIRSPCINFDPPHRFHASRLGASGGDGHLVNPWLPLCPGGHHRGPAGSRGAPAHAKTESRGAVTRAVDVGQFSLRVLVSLSFSHQRQRYAGTWALAFHISLDGCCARSD